MDSPQITLKARVKQILGASGDNTLGWIKTPAPIAYHQACWIGHWPGIEPATHGIFCCIDGMAQYGSERYSPFDRRIPASCGLTLDLWLPQDLNAITFAEDSRTLERQGKTLPAVIESMDRAALLLMHAIKDLSIVQTVRMLPPVQRGVYDNAPTKERVRINVVFCPELCIEEKIALA